MIRNETPTPLLYPTSGYPSSRVKTPCDREAQPVAMLQCRAVNMHTVIS